MSSSSRHILAAPAWPYANGPRHIGHVSGFGLPCDMFSRYQRMAGNRVLMVSGTDEHGTPIQVQADAEGVTARELADRYNRVIAEDLTNLGMSYDLFTRTTTRNHYAVTPSRSAWTWIGVPCSSVPETISTLLPAIRWYRLNMSLGMAKPET